MHYAVLVMFRVDYLCRIRLYVIIMYVDAYVFSVPWLSDTFSIRLNRVNK